MQSEIEYRNGLNAEEALAEQGPRQRRTASSFDRDDQPENSIIGQDSVDSDRSSVSSDSLRERMPVYSNTAFFLGSIFYVWIAISDVVAYESGSMDDDAFSSESPSMSPSDENSKGDDEYGAWDELNLLFSYKVVSCAGAFGYVANAIIDFAMATMEMKAEVRRGRYGDDPRLELGVALTFGIAASCDFVGALTFDEDAPSYTASSAAVHVYLLNALLVITGRRPNFASWPEAFTGAGDILFLIGSVIDVVISYFLTPEAALPTLKTMAWWNLASAVLWFVDSILYILADLAPTSYNLRDYEDGLADPLLDNE